MASLRQLANSRRTRGITQQEMADRMGCSVQWVRWLESTNYTNTVKAATWRNRYAYALHEAIRDRDVVISGKT